eukprot:851018-Rhodomonas_salina.1
MPCTRVDLPGVDLPAVESTRVPGYPRIRFPNRSYAYAHGPGHKSQANSLETKLPTRVPRVPGYPGTQFRPRCRYPGMHTPGYPSTRVSQQYPCRKAVPLMWTLFYV